MHAQRKPIYFLKFPAILLSLVFAASHASAQFLFFAKKPIVINRESIDQYEGSQLKDSIPFSGIRIIDSRYDTTGLGFYLDGLLALKDTPMISGLQHIIEKYYRPLCLTGRDTLIIQLEKLSIQDAIIRDTGFILTEGSVKALLYQGRNNAYQYIGTVDSLYQEKYNTRTTNKSNRNGKHNNGEFWDYYLLRLYEAMIKKASAPQDSLKTDSGRNYSLEEIKKTGLAKREKPILKADSLHPGFYRDFAEFVNNNPTFEYVNREALKNLLEVMHYRVGKNISNEEPDTTYWGFCVGKRIYVRYQYSFYQLLRRDDMYYIAPTLDARRRDLNQSALNLLIGLAALSGSIAAKSSPEFGGFSALPAPEIPMIMLRGRDYYILGLQLDWDTGKVTY